jgi:hypothetical protein
MPYPNEHAAGSNGSAAVENIELHGIGNAISNTHDVILQRLDTLIKNNGRMIHYTAEAFDNVDAWRGIPVIYAKSNGKSLKHPDGASVTAGNLPAEYQTVGRVAGATKGTGEPVLRGVLQIDDPELDRKAAAGTLSLSTGFGGQIANINGQDKLAGQVAPNHVLIFDRGACPNCYPNDNSARFENLKEKEEFMDEESKGLFKRFTEAIENLKPAEHVQEEIKEMVDNTEEIKNITEERDKALKELEEMKNAAKLEKAEAAWTEMKNILPEGWLGDKEKATREEFETNAAGFAVKLAKFTAENATAAKGAEGSETSTTPIDAENLAQAEVEKFEKESGLFFF